MVEVEMSEMVSCAGDLRICQGGLNFSDAPKCVKRWVKGVDMQCKSCPVLTVSGVSHANWWDAFPILGIEEYRAKGIRRNNTKSPKYSVYEYR